jgi:1-acyl-sn-glycerol-3-phosphate acyltransferase
MDAYRLVDPHYHPCKNMGGPCIDRCNEYARRRTASVTMFTYTARLPAQPRQGVAYPESRRRDHGVGAGAGAG